MHDKTAALEQALRARARRLLAGRDFGAGAPDADDLVQGVLLRLLESEQGAAVLQRPVDDVLPYAYRALHHLFIDRCHRKRREVLAPDVAGEGDGGPATPDHSPELQAMRTQERDRKQAWFAAATASWSEQERAFLLACLLQPSAAAAQRKTGWPPGGASNATHHRNALLHKARAYIRHQQAEQQRAEEDAMTETTSTRGRGGEP